MNINLTVNLVSKKFRKIETSWGIFKVLDISNTWILPPNHPSNELKLFQEAHQILGNLSYPKILPQNEGFCWYLRNKMTKYMAANWISSKNHASNELKLMPEVLQLVGNLSHSKILSQIQGFCQYQRNSREIRWEKHDGELNFIQNNLVLAIKTFLINFFSSFFSP